MNDNPTISSVDTSGASESDAAEAALLALGGVLTWHKDDGEYSAQYTTAGYHRESYFVGRHRDGVASDMYVRISSRYGDCLFYCASVGEAKAVCEHYAITGDWERVKHLEARARFYHGFDAETVGVSSGALKWMRDVRRHSDSTIIVLKGFGHRRQYKLSVSTIHPRDRWSIRLFWPVLDVCPERFGMLDEAQAACERHVGTGSWSEPL